MLQQLYLVVFWPGDAMKVESPTEDTPAGPLCHNLDNRLRRVPTGMYGKLLVTFILIVRKRTDAYNNANVPT